MKGHVHANRERLARNQKDFAICFIQLEWRKNVRNMDYFKGKKILLQKRKESNERHSDVPCGVCSSAESKGEIRFHIRKSIFLDERCSLVTVIYLSNEQS